MEEPRAIRIRRRVTCELIIDGQRSKGIVLNVSQTGIFVQTSAIANRGQTIDVHITGSGSIPDMSLTGEVARKNQVPQRLARVATSGVGLRILDPPPEYQQLCKTEAGTVVTSRPLPKESSPKASSRFSVRVGQLGGPRTRTIVVDAADEDAARTQALAQAGDGWKILKVDPC